MCGICGKMLLREDRVVDPALIDRMSSVMNHRGPDDYGTYVSRRIGLGHRRLSIIDLQTGKQPISNERGNIWVVFNGEIYNFIELRKLLVEKGHVFRTRTDTEVIVHMYEELGEAFVSELRGMFAIALWDELEQTLILARDRVGIKPLYYYHTDDSVTFGSEMKAILADSAVPGNVNPHGIGLLLKYYYIPGEETLLQGIKKLLPGHYLVVKNGKCVIREYWDLAFPVVKDRPDYRDAERKLADVIRRSVRDHMISDVPVGFLLSGGVDSTALLSFAVEDTDKAISTFTIGFTSDQFADERKYAALAARKYGTTHYDMTIDAHEFASFLPEYVWHMEEPICEPPAMALYYVSKLAKGHVKVLLSGEGGDEAFAGYQNYRNIVWLERIKKLIRPLNPVMGSAVSLLASMGPFGRLRKYGFLCTMDFNDYYFSRTSSPFTYLNKHAESLFTPEFYGSIAAGKNHDFMEYLLRKIGDAQILDKMLYLDTKTWLPDDLLVKADKITMASSIELRVPLLDHRVLEYAATLPVDFKLKGFTTKYILKNAFKGRVPDEILYRKKTGFPVPYDQWFSNELHGYVRDILFDSRTVSRGYFKKGFVTGMLDSKKGQSAFSKEIFLLVVLELWHRAFVDQGLEGTPLSRQSGLPV